MSFDQTDIDNLIDKMTATRSTTVDGTTVVRRSVDELIKLHNFMQQCVSTNATKSAYKYENSNHRGLRNGSSVPRIHCC